MRDDATSTIVTAPIASSRLTGKEHANNRVIVFIKLLGNLALQPPLLIHPFCLFYVAQPRGVLQNRA